jgi:glycosyltransferase involved in cell wall biosynthesis
VNAETASSSPKPLRILLLLNLKWDERLGAVRVYMDLAEEWRSAGHIVEHYSLSDAFPRAGDSAAGFSIRQVLFAHKAKAFVRKNAARFDIIDALIGALPDSKDTLGFHGLLVARSVGLYRLYERFEKSAQQRWPRPSRGKLLGRILYTLTRRWLLAASDKSVCHADLVNVPNEDEATCLRRETATSLPVTVQPYGLTAEKRRALARAAAPPPVRLARKKISFVGMWSTRKGAQDWPAIIRKVRQEIPESRFSFLGTMVDSQTVLRDLGLESSDGLELISDYSPADLSGLLSDCTAGVFPSYAEGFGLAVLEQLAAGIPTVAYDVAPAFVRPACSRWQCRNHCAGGMQNP